MKFDCIITTKDKTQ